MNEGLTNQHGGYENLDTTKMLATSCVLCGKPLLDGASVEAGMGKTCRSKHGGDEISAETRKEANKLVHKAGVLRQKSGSTIEFIEVIHGLREIGCDTIADAIATRCVAPEITLNKEGSFYQLTIASVSKLSTSDVRGMKWNLIAEFKENVPNTDGFNKKGEDNIWRYHFNSRAKRTVWDIMKKIIPGAKGTAPDGSAFVIPAPLASYRDAL